MKGNVPGRCARHPKTKRAGNWSVRDQDHDELCIALHVTAAGSTLGSGPDDACMMHDESDDGGLNDWTQIGPLFAIGLETRVKAQSRPLSSAPMEVYLRPAYQANGMASDQSFFFLKIQATNPTFHSDCRALIMSRYDHHHE